MVETHGLRTTVLEPAWLPTTPNPKLTWTGHMTFEASVYLKASKTPFLYLGEATDETRKSCPLWHHFWRKDLDRPPGQG